MIMIISQIHLTVAPWEERTNTLDFSVLSEMSYLLTFRIFSLSTSFLLTSYWVVLESLKLLVLF